MALVDESRFYLLPAKLKTYAPIGQTPVLHNWQSRNHLLIMGAIAMLHIRVADLNEKLADHIHNSLTARPVVNEEYFAMAT